VVAAMATTTHQLRQERAEALRRYGLGTTLSGVRTWVMPGTIGVTIEESTGKVPSLVPRTNTV
jgi:hypothetical protein